MKLISITKTSQSNHDYFLYYFGEKSLLSHTEFFLNSTGLCMSYLAFSYTCSDQDSLLMKHQTNNYMYSPGPVIVGISPSFSPESFNTERIG